MFELIKKIFILVINIYSFTGLVNGSNHTKCVSFSKKNV